MTNDKVSNDRFGQMPVCKQPLAYQDLCATVAPASTGRALIAIICPNGNPV